MLTRQIWCFLFLSNWKLPFFSLNWSIFWWDKNDAFTSKKTFIYHEMQNDFEILNALKCAMITWLFGRECDILWQRVRLNEFDHWWKLLHNWRSTGGAGTWSFTITCHKNKFIILTWLCCSCSLLILVFKGPFLSNSCY